MRSARNMVHGIGCFFPIGVCMEMLMPSFGDSNRETGSEPVDLGLPDLSVDEYWV